MHSNIVSVSVIASIVAGTHGYFDPGEQELRLTLKMEVTMDSVTCCAPVWNSTEWVSKAYKTEVQGLHSDYFI